jgi:LysM repeat protein
MRSLILIAALFSFSNLWSQTPLKVIHTVKKGETLYKISRDYDMTVSQLREMNPQVEILQPGMKLNVIKKLDVQSRQTKFVEHTVKKGETLYRISQKYQVKVREIREANGLLENKISIGQTLKIPSGETIAAESPKPADKTASSNNSIIQNQKLAVLDKAKQKIIPETNPEIKGGIIEKRSGSTKTEYIAKNDVKKAQLLDTSAANTAHLAQKAFVWIAGLPANQVICITNARTQQMAYALNQGKREKQNSEVLILTPFMAEKLGVTSPATELKIQYVVPKP